MPRNPYLPPHADLAPSTMRDPAFDRLGMPGLSGGIYMAVCAAAAAAPLLAELAEFVFGMHFVGTDALYPSLSLLALAALTYPAGFPGTVIALSTIWLGLLTPAEAVVLSAPLSAVPGYLQWYVLLPRLVRRSVDNVRAPVSTLLASLEIVLAALLTFASLKVGWTALVPAADPLEATHDEWSAVVLVIAVPLAASLWLTAFALLKRWRSRWLLHGVPAFAVLCAYLFLWLLERGWIAL